MPVLNLSFLGIFAAALDEQPIHNFKTDEVQAFLITRTVERDHHRGILWPELSQDSAQENPEQALN